MNYYKEIKDQILNNEAYERIKDYSKERHRVLTYFEIGRLLYEAGKHYGENIISKYADLLEKEFGQKCNKRNLFRMKQFYLMYGIQRNTKLSHEPQNNNLPSIKKQNVSPHKYSSSKTPYLIEDFSRKVSPPFQEAQKIQSLNFYEPSILSIITSLTWTHYIYLITVKNETKRSYYTNIAINNNLSVRELKKRIKSKEYERLDEKTRNKLINKEDLSIKDYVPNPILIKSTSNKDVISEKILHNLIMEDIASFMKELGEGYSFIDSEYKIKIDDRFNYIDFLLYNLRFRCYVVIELKVTKFKTEYIGQILKYMNYVDSNIKTIEDNNTIGIIICKRNNSFYLEYCSDERIITREYRLI